jgi:hypothetical protein
MKRLGHGVKLQDGSEIKTNAAACADDLILHMETHKDMETFLIFQFRSFAKMNANAEKCGSMSQVWIHSPKGKADRVFEPFVIHTDVGEEEIPMYIVSIYLGMPVGFNRYENAKHRQEILPDRR